MLMRRAAIIAHLAATALPSPALAAADCGLIRDRDLRRACFAEQKRRPSECNLISDGDARRMCRLRAERR